MNFLRSFPLVKNKNSYPKGENKKLSFPNPSPEVLQILVGEADQNLKAIEKELDIQIGRSPAGLLIEGQDTEVELACDLLQQFQGLVEKGERIWPGDIERSIKMLSANRKMRLEDFLRDQISVAGKKHSIIPRTVGQKIYLEAIRHADMVFGVGPAGTGKTYLAMAMAVSALLKKQVKRVILCRPAVEAGERLGFLPGDMAEKVNPYLRPLYDALYDMVDYDKAQEMMERGQIEVAPLAFMRGRTLSNAFVILDEAQNTTHLQMKMFLTRLGFNSRCVVTGDVTQVDLPQGVKSGLKEALAILKNI
ncbi:MAG: PhoH family protein, partial [SAR324 cluster bacterium]|nr:PhoH family protein [SAR324 cluster bacterium]